MLDWNNQLVLSDLTPGDELPSISIPITLQRLVMEAGSNRDLSLIHHNKEVAQSTGASDAYMNTFFILGLFERLLREWMGVKGSLKKISSLQMKSFNVVGDIITCKGKVSGIEKDGTITIDVWMENEGETTVSALAEVLLPE